jgi:hypothetical protein
VRPRRHYAAMQNAQPMNENRILVIASLLTILFTSFHLADDIVRKMSPGGMTNVAPILVWVAWLYATLILAGRRSGLVTILLASLLSFGVPLVHMTNKGGAVGGRIAETTGAFFFAWTILMTAVTALLSVVLSARGLWRLRRSEQE